MSGLQFMNQDGEWEKFPSDEEMQILKELQEVAHPPVHPEITTVCHLCNEPCPTNELAFWIQGQALTWSCNKCHAVNESKP